MKKKVILVMALLLLAGALYAGGSGESSTSDSSTTTYHWSESGSSPRTKIWTTPSSSAHTVKFLWYTATKYYTTHTVSYPSFRIAIYKDGAFQSSRTGSSHYSSSTYESGSKINKVEYDTYTYSKSWTTTS